jgi:predicted N-formylglutamate amidohydrolase
MAQVPPRGNAAFVAFVPEIDASAQAQAITVAMCGFLLRFSFPGAAHKSAEGKIRVMCMADAYSIEGADRPGRWLITADHASNRVPDDVAGGDLGVAPADMARHIAWDVGAAGVARALGQALDSPVICSDFSRLVIDPNRGKDDPTLVMKLYDGTIIPANRHADAAEVARRVERFYQPYHQALAQLAARQEDTVLVAVHSFTPCLNGRSPRPWQVGVLYSHLDARLSRPLIARLRAEPDLCVGDNEPYSGHLPGDSIDQHALTHGRHNTLIELRNDLISSPEQQRAWAMRLAPLLVAALTDTLEAP